jgi:branched-chain amino acid aminotransferase
MSERTYISLNGEFKKTSDPCLYPHNRAFRYGDALVENMHACGTELQFPGLHLDRLFANMRLLSMEIPAFFTVENFRQLTVQLLNKNRIFGGAQIRLTVYRDSDKAFISDLQRISFLLESQGLDGDHYVLNDRGLTIDISNEYRKFTGSLPGIRTAHNLLYLMAGMEGRKKNLDAVIILNETGRMVETNDSNVFLVSGDSIFTPGIQQGCIPGVMRQVLLELSGEAGYRTNDQSSLTPAALDDAEEVFLTSAIYGIRWVGAYRQRRYYKKVAKVLNGKLNEIAFKSG